MCAPIATWTSFTGSRDSSKGLFLPSFLPWHLAAAFALDLAAGDPRGWPHPVRWIGGFIARLEALLYPRSPSPDARRAAGIALVLAVAGGTAVASCLFLRLAYGLHSVAGHAAAVWLAFTTLATRSLHAESRRVLDALDGEDLPLARERLSWIVSRDTDSLSEREVLRGVLETVSENLSDGVVAPLFYLALGGPVLAMTYKAVSTMDSMVGYVNERYRYFGWLAAKMDDALNWIPARLTGILLVPAALLLRLDARSAWTSMWRDGPAMKSPNAGYPEAAAAGALGITLGGPSVYRGQVVEKPLLGRGPKVPTRESYRSMIRLMYVSSLLAFLAGLVFRAWIA